MIDHIDLSDAPTRAMLCGSKNCFSRCGVKAAGCPAVALVIVATSSLPGAGAIAAPWPAALPLLAAFPVGAPFLGEGLQALAHILGAHDPLAVLVVALPCLRHRQVGRRGHQLP